MRVEYHPTIGAELRAIQDYYEERSPGLGGEFIDEFERQALQLAGRPERG
jgi:toxin ParE1/3/4